jgi:hypothetical protein
MDLHPEMDCFEGPSGDFTDDVPVPDTLMPPGWDDDPNWDSDTSIWTTLKVPEDTEDTDQPKASSKKCKK